MGAKQKPSSWDNVVPETLDDYICLCRCNVRRKLPPHVKEAIEDQMRDDLDQEILCLALEAREKKMSVPEASRFFKSGIYQLVRGVGGWKLGYVKYNVSEFPGQLPVSETLLVEENLDHFHPPG